jgi:hypothetical protein
LRLGETNRVGATAPVTRMVFWVMVSLVAWQLYQGLRIGAAVPTGSWPISPVDVVFLVLIPALCAFTFIRLFLVLTQSASGTMNVYAALSSPWAWVFWLGACITMIGHGVRVAGNALWRQLPEAFAQGEFANKVSFIDVEFGYTLLGLGLFFMSLATLFVGYGANQRLSRPERLLFLVGSLASYGTLGILMGVFAHQYIPTIAGGALLTFLGMMLVPPSEIMRDPITAMMIPGAFVSALVLLIWTLIVGGQPTIG